MLPAAERSRTARLASMLTKPILGDEHMIADFNEFSIPIDRPRQRVRDALVIVLLGGRRRRHHFLIFECHLVVGRWRRIICDTFVLPATSNSNSSSPSHPISTLVPLRRVAINGIPGVCTQKTSPPASLIISIPPRHSQIGRTLTASQRPRGAVVSVPAKLEFINVIGSFPQTGSQPLPEAIGHTFPHETVSCSSIAAGHSRRHILP